MRPAFHFNAAACSGCKACQVACRDRHQLPAGVAWRRVYEVSGGGWRRDGEAWVNDVVAYHLSLACNHCDQPICVEVCPAGAMQRRADGVVLVDAGRCVGCQYCAWACPYGAPQFDAAAGQVTKCDLCAAELDAGRPPVCVAACPLRSLTVDGVDGAPRDASFPLPAVELTRPALALRPPAAALGRTDLRVANREEVRALPLPAEHSLVAFTLLAQSAAGLVWLLALLPGDVGFLPRLAPAALMAAAALASLLHLGRPGRAWRALRNLRTSWLSREVLAVALFGAACAGVAVLPAVGSAHFAPPAPAYRALLLATAALGAFLLYAMARVYRLRTAPVWNRWRTPAEFFASAAALGALVASALLAPGTYRLLAVVGLLAAAALAVRWRGGFYRSHLHTRPL